jgi:hypothetical protein
MIWERKRCDWLFFTVSKGKRDNGSKQTGNVKVQTSGPGGSGYTGNQTKTGYGNQAWTEGDKAGNERRSGSSYDR